MKNQNPCQNLTQISHHEKKICFVLVFSNHILQMYIFNMDIDEKKLLRSCNSFFLYMYEYIYQCVYFDLRCYYIFICWEIKYEKQTHKSLVYVRDAMQVLRSVSFSVSKVLVHFLQNTCLQFGCSCHCSFF